MRGAERRVYYYDVELGTNKKDASPPPMVDVINAIATRYEESKASHSINKDTATLEIGDMLIDEEEGHALLLVQISDRTAPDPYLSNPIEGTSRVVRKEEGEGRGFGAHLLVSLTAEPETPNTYRVLLEKNTGLHRSHVNRLLHAILRTLYQEDPTVFTCDHAGGQRTREGLPKQVEFRPMLEFTGHPSESLIQELEQGELKEISLIHNEQQGPLGGRAWLQKEERILKVKAKFTNRVRNVWQNLQAVFAAQAQAGYEHARIKFKTQDGESASVDIDTATGNTLLHDKYVKSRRITDIDPPMDESSDEIVEHFATKLIELFSED